MEKEEEIVGYRLGKIEESLEEVKNLMLQMNLQKRDIDEIKKDCNENRQAINSHDKRLKELELKPLSNAANKWNFIIDYAYKFIIMGIVGYFAVKLGSLL